MWACNCQGRLIRFKVTETTSRPYDRTYVRPLSPPEPRPTTYNRRCHLFFIFPTCRPMARQYLTSCSVLADRLGQPPVAQWYKAGKIQPRLTCRGHLAVSVFEHNESGIVICLRHEPLRSTIEALSSTKMQHSSTKQQFGHTAISKTSYQQHPNKHDQRQGGN